MLNRSIIQLALKYVEFDLHSSSILKILNLGIKANAWCSKHLKMTLLSNQESQEEEHVSVFYQLLLEAMRFSASTFLALMKFPVFDDRVLMDAVANFVLEALSLAKASISDVKKLQSFGSEILKVAHMMIDAVIKLCKALSESVNSDTYDVKLLNLDKDNNKMVHVINITRCAIEKLSQIGVLAANDGGNSVNILNVTWKGVVSLLQIGHKYLAEIVSIANVLVGLIALVTEPLKCAAVAWSSPKDTVSKTEAKRILVPVKFYLINAVKIASLYPHQAYAVYRDIMLCVIKITTLKIATSNEIFLESVCTVTTELLEQTSMDLAMSLLNSDELKFEQKSEVLEWLFTNEGDSYSTLDASTLANCSLTSTNEIFDLRCEDMNGERILMTARVALFINFLRCSLEFDEGLKLGLAHKLQRFLDILVEEDVYSNVLFLKLPLLRGSGNTIQLVWQPLFTSLLHAVKTFMIVVSSTAAWGDMESFLLENFFHPHSLCWEIVMECWCFMLRHAETDLAYSMISKLCSLLKLLASSESVALPNSSFRILARSICFLLTYGAKPMVNQVYMSLVEDATTHLSSILCLALFIEGFPLDSLSDKLRNTAIQRVISDYFEFIDSFDEASLKTSISGLCGIPVSILSASLQSFQTSIPYIDPRTLKLLVSVTRNFKGSEDKVIKDHCLTLLGELLQMISNLRHLYSSNGIEEAILEIENTFVSGPTASDGCLHKCKPHLAQFMAGLIHTELSEIDDDDSKNCAVLNLFHMLLKEKHWAFIHLALTAFGYFAMHTKYNKLWRFVPPDAALSYDLVSGAESDQDRFTEEIKAFLNKEMALLSTAPNTEQLELLARDGRVLKQMVHKIPNIAEAEVKCVSMEVDDDHNNCSNKKRKLRDGIIKGVELLKSGLKIIGDGLSQWDQNQFGNNELHVKFLTQFAQLENVVTHFGELAGNRELCSSLGSEHFS
ncbi:uncharacterized protein LOC114750374 [Neltuma alba]|uniref:uncharacterized protein LOC114750374 n=1 Tax=Neltuma alba TaxID=207710 RepID=UPI0010A59F37|nr:uncharacterized protein LOC114750374 [Prosopis alba]